jgi:uncharacterized repeat protein (TIGR01451 family)
MNLKARIKVPLEILGLIFFLSGCGFLNPMNGPEEENVNAGSSISESEKIRVEANYGKLPLYFIQNDGQVDERVKYYEKGNGHTTFFTKEGVYLTLTRSSEKASQNEKSVLKPSTIPPGETIAPLSTMGREEITSEDVIKLNFVNANPNPEIIAKEQQEGKVNYFIGNDPKKWRMNIPTYQSVVYKEVYPGIDIKFYGNNRQMEYDIIVKPGADLSKVELAYEGVEKLEVTEAGDLEIILKEGKIIQRKPIVYQEIDGNRVKVRGMFKTHPYSTFTAGIYAYGFAVASYNLDHPLIIDPALVYSTYLGGSNSEVGIGIAVDVSGNAYVAGYTYSANFPTASPLQGTPGGNSDAFVSKLNAAGNALIYSTYLGGASDDIGVGIGVDGSGNAYVTGSTQSFNFPMASPLQSTFGGLRDVFVAKLNAAGAALVYSTYLGGNTDDAGNGIVLDASGNTYVTGSTASSNFPTANPLQGTSGGDYDAFVAKLNAAGSVLVYSTYLGGNSTEYGYSITVDGSGNTYVTGHTKSSNFPTVNPLQGICGNCGSGFGYGDTFVAKLNATGSVLGYSTYLGGSSFDEGFGITVDASGNAYVTGITQSSNFPTASPLQGTFGGVEDAFVAKLNASGSALAYSTYLGGSCRDDGYSIAVDTSGAVYVTGNTCSTNFPTVSSLQANGGSDAFVAKLNASGSALAYSTYLGGSGSEIGYGIAVDTSGNAYVTGDTQSSDFPTVNPPQGTFGGVSDAFVAKISPLTEVDLSIAKTDFPDPVAVGTNLTYTITVTNNGPSTATGVTVTDTLPAGVSYVSATPSQGSCSGTSTVTCNLGNLANGASATVTIVVTPTATGTLSNTACASGNESDPDTNNNCSTATTTVNPASADLSITKTDSPDPVLVGQNLSYTITVTNNGPSTATGVTVTDALPAGVTFVSSNPSQGSCSGTSTVTCDLGNLANGASATVTIVVTPTTTGTKTNTACVSANETDPNSGNDCSTATTTVNSNPNSADLSITKTDVPDPVERRADLTYTMVVTNNGSLNATGVTLTDTLPSGITIRSMSTTQGSCSSSGSVVTCNLGAMENGSSATVTIVVRSNSTGTLTNTASVTGNQSDSNSGNNSITVTTTVVTSAADLSVTKTDSPDPVTVGNSLSYTIVVTNNGPSRADGVMLTDTLPGGVTYVNAWSTRGTCSEAGGTVTCNIGRMRDGRSETVTIVVTPTGTGTLTNTASVTSSEADPVPGNNSATETTTVNAPSNNTPAGSNVSVPLGNGVSVTFSNVSTAGQTTIDITTTGSPPPTSFRLGKQNIYYDVNTTAVFSGPMTICFIYDDTQFSREDKLKLFHFEGSNWTDVTDSLDTNTNMICAVTTSLSPFVVVEPDIDDLGNISTRGSVLTGASVMIGGFIIEGTVPKTVLVRAQGPSLVDFGVTGVMSNPTMQLYSGSTVIAQNNNWQTTDPLCLSPVEYCGDSGDIIATGFDPCTAATTGCTLDSAIYVTLPPGPYTAIVSGVGGGTGVGLVGVFDVDTSGALSYLGNISTRGFVGTSANVQIGGFIIEGTVPKTVLVRAQGPSLVDFGVTGALPNPTMTLYSGATPIAVNNNWQDPVTQCDSPAISCGDDQDIIATGLDPCTAATTGCTLDSAIYVTLPPGAYTAIVSGVGGSIGVGLVGVFEVP